MQKLINGSMRNVFLSGERGGPSDPRRMVESRILFVGIRESMWLLPIPFFTKKFPYFPSNFKPVFFIQGLLFPGGSVYNTTNTFSNISKCKSVDGKSSVVCPFQRADGGARQQGNPM